MSDLPAVELFDNVTKTELKGLSVGLGDVAIDSIMNDGLLKDIPILSSLVSLSKIGSGIRDRMYIKKVVLFLDAISKCEAVDRKKISDQLDTDANKRKFGETILLLIEQADNIRKPELMGHL
jgi:hypothetical protein